jgi:hypothetical protein
MSVPYVHTGNVLFVGNSSANAADNISTNGGSADKPLSTLIYALTKTTANNGDVVLLMPGHAEDVALDWTFTSSSISGVKIIGIGEGDARPKFSYTTGGATNFVWFNGPSGVLLENLRFHSASSDPLAALYIDGANFTIRHCFFTEDTSNGWDNVIVTSAEVANGADGIVIEDCYFWNPDTNGECISVNHTDNVTIRNNLLMGHNQARAIGMDTTSSVSTPIFILDNIIYNAASVANSCIRLNASSTGFVARNLVSNAHATDKITATACGIAQNFASVNADDESGILEPVAT